MVTRLAFSWPRRAVCGVVVAVVCAGASAEAAHRARLSADLADDLARGKQSIEVIVQGDRTTVDTLARRYNLVVKRYHRTGAILRVNAGQLAALQQDTDVDHLSGNNRLRSTPDLDSNLTVNVIADVTAESIGADQVWAGVGNLRGRNGKGIGVALIDSGIDLRHHAVRNRVAATVDLIGGNGIDRHGHGTHLASIIAGRPGTTPDTEAYRGIAFGAHLINLRVLGDDGSGTVGNVLQAIDWTIEHRNEFNIRVINLSLGGAPTQPVGDDPMCEAIERATKAGIAVIAAAGNWGQASDGKTVFESITVPGNCPDAITVGAVDTAETAKRSDDAVTPWSSRGPTRFDHLIKPDIVAPGRRIVGAEVMNSYVSRTYPERHVGGDRHSSYVQYSGTSQAAAVVSGAMALLLEGRTTVAPQASKAILQLASSSMPAAGLLAAGAGYVNVLSAVELLSGGSIINTTIADEQVIPGGLTFLAVQLTGEVGNQRILWGTQVLSVNQILWGTQISSGDTILWGTQLVSDDTILWGTQVSD